MIYSTIDNASQFRDAFHRANRATQFSYEALGLLFDYLNDCGSDVELDVVGICCEFSEMTLNEVIDNYDTGIDAETITQESEENLLTMVTDYLQDNTSLVGLTSMNTFVFVQF